jgi:RNA recognition motif-containing protein
MLEVQEECDKYGKVLELKIPRPAGARSSPGVGKIYVKFEQPESAQKALAAMSGRKFSDRTVVVTYFGEVSYSILTAEKQQADRSFRNTLILMRGKSFKRTVSKALIPGYVCSGG